MSSADSRAKAADANDAASTDAHPLAHAYQLWFTRKVAGVKTQETYSQNLVSLGIFRTVCHAQKL